MPEDIQKSMRALVAQHGSALVALATLLQHLEAQHNDEQTNSLENSIPRINALAEFNQDTSKFTCERCNCLQRKRHAMQHTESTGPFELPQERSNHLHRERRIVQQATTCAQPSLGNDALQQHIESAEPFEMPQERSNRLRRE